MRRKLIAAGILLMMLSMSLLIIPSSDTIKAHTEATKGTWTAYPGSDSYHFNSSDIATMTQIRREAGYGSFGSWDNARNGTTGTSGGSAVYGDFITVSNYFAGPTYTSIFRTFIRMDISALPIGGHIEHIFLNMTWTGGQYPFTQRMYVVLVPDDYPHDPMDLNDYNRKNYDPINLTVAHNDTDLGWHQWTFNNTGRIATGVTANATGSVYLTFMMISGQDLNFNHNGNTVYTGPANWEILWGPESGMEMTVVVSGGHFRGPPPPFQDHTIDWLINGGMIGMIGVLGLIIMVASPYIIIKKYQNDDYSGTLGMSMFFFLEMLGLGLLIASYSVL